MTKKFSEAVLKFRDEVCCKSELIDPGERMDWEALAFGFLLGCGFTPEEIPPELPVDMSIGEFEPYL